MSEKHTVVSSLERFVESVRKDPSVLSALDTVFQFQVHEGGFKLEERDFEEHATKVMQFITLDTRVGTKPEDILKVAKGAAKNKNKDAKITFRVFEHNWNEIVYKLDSDGETFIIPEPGEPGRLDPIVAFMGSMMLLEGELSLAMKLPIIVVLARGHQLKKQA